jgi:hypothetical protein
MSNQKMYFDLKILSMFDDYKKSFEIQYQVDIDI